MRASVLLSALLVALALVQTLCLGQQQRASLYTFQEATVPYSTRSITFLSAGYDDSDHFLADVRACVASLTNNTGAVNADPWPRYAPLLSIYAVFEADNAVGMSCDTAFADPRYLACDRTATGGLLSVSPVEDIAVVLVNNATVVAGSGANGIAYITNHPEYMTHLLVHHLNGAVAALRQEYNMRVAEPAATAESHAGHNCAASAADAAAKWGHWRDTALPGEEPLSADATGHGCTFSNLLAPTPGGCIMANSSATRMCPVCRERLIASLFAPTAHFRRSDPAPLNLLAARCPPEGYTTYVSGDGAATEKGVFLSVGKFAYQNDVEVRWLLPDGTEVLRDSFVFALPDASVLPLPTTVTAVVADKTPLVRSAWRAEAQTRRTDFRIERRGTADVACAPVTSTAVTCAESAIWSLTLPPDDFSLCFAKPAGAADASTATPSTTDAITESGPSRFSRPSRHRAASTAATDDTAPSPSNLRRRLASVLEEESGAADFTPDPNAKEPTYNKRDVIIAAAVAGGLCLIILIVVLSVYFAYYRRHPHEVLNVYWLDQLIYGALPVLCSLALILATLAIIFTVVYIPLEFFFGNAIFIAAIVLGCIVFICAAVNLCSAFFHLYVVSLICGIIFFIMAVGFFAIGAFCVWAHMNTRTKIYVDTLENLWESTIEGSKGNTYICDMQETMKCSGFRTSCAVTGDSAQCPSDCASNSYTNPCVFQASEFIKKRYMPIGVVCLIAALIFVLTGFVDVLYFLRFRQLSRTGKLRRTFRRDPQPPVIPITYKEAQKARGMFETVSDDPSNTLEGKKAARFLEKVFDEHLSEEYVEAIHKCGPLTFDQLMSIHFPYMLSTATDPRMLTADEAEPCANMIELQKKQISKLDEFMTASGTLSPETLQTVFQGYARERFLPQKKEVLELIRAAAAKCSDQEMFTGLAPNELEALRGVWVALHPSVTGCLTDEEIDRFYQWSHEEPLEDTEAFNAWKKHLDVRGTGEIGWPEFCYPYAQRARLLAARNFLDEKDKELPPETVAREDVEKKFSHDIVKAVFFEYEKEVPVERLIAYVMQTPRGIEALKKRKKK